MKGEGAVMFPMTRWTLVERAGSGGEKRALEELCRLYWYPLYAFARSRGHGAEDAEDLTQGFFQRLLSGGMLAQANGGSGRLRSYLLKAFEFDLIDARRHRLRHKRGGGATMVPLDGELAERLWSADAGGEGGVQAFERAWVATVLRAAMAELAESYAARGQAEVFAGLRPFLDPGAERREIEVLERELGLSPAAARQALHRLRERFRLAVRKVIAGTLENPDEAAIQEEFQAFAAILRES